MPKVKLKVARRDPKRGSWWQEYEIDVDKYTSVAVALQRVREEIDPTLAYRPLCKMGVCGNCAVKINGQPKLACMTNALEAAEEGKGTIVVEPLDNMEVIRDLITDRREFEKRMVKVRPYLVPKEEALKSDKWTPISPSIQKVLWSSAQCIWCGICYSVCPVSYVDSQFVGPHALLKVFRFSHDPRDALDGKRIVLNEIDIWKCANCGYCTDTCPKNLKHEERYHVLRKEDSEMAMEEYAIKAIKHVKAVIESIAETGRADEVRIFTSTGLVEAGIDALPKLVRGGWKRPPYVPRGKVADWRLIEAFREAVGGI
ncbi:succinate dehydrogenase [Ignicoccus islandicus DSM 13165]|uniref:succinate dehydrogenase n=1 Tax=Ignicoccus islandicus DSM 13165 TaxID=940295 RepID=A0A0U3FJF5_9CREN|nr:succinate dehydrogenase/fumarate reductase iron-sulfur subunit [Ignicoccus islandicus]ALU11990.1 succinate dehydrogenase [Ignicoccus islandicus DSM 13165]